MRVSVFASVLSVLALGALVSAPADAAKSKMGCEIGSEVWNAGAGKCEPGASKWKRGDTEKKAAAADMKPDKKAGQEEKGTRKEVAAQSQPVLPSRMTSTLSCGTSSTGMLACSSPRTSPRSTRLTPPCEATMLSRSTSASQPATRSDSMR